MALAKFKIDLEAKFFLKNFASLVEKTHTKPFLLSIRCVKTQLLEVTVFFVISFFFVSSSW